MTAAVFYGADLLRWDGDDNTTIEEREFSTLHNALAWLTERIAAAKPNVDLHGAVCRGTWRTVDGLPYWEQDPDWWCTGVPLDDGTIEWEEAQA